MTGTDEWDSRTEGLRVVSKALKEMTERELEEWKQKMFALLPQWWEVKTND
jgi:hypothetical protein